MEEIWRPVVGFEDSHEVSNIGRVRTVERTIVRRASRWRGPTTQVVPQRVLGLRFVRGGYLRATISLDGEQKQRPVHRLVAAAFLEPAPSPHHQINHKDGDKTNNRVENLEWCTAQENSLHAYKTGLSASAKGTKHGSAKLTDIQISEIRELKGKLTQREIAKRFDVAQPQISRIMTSKRWKHVS